MPLLPFLLPKPMRRFIVLFSLAASTALAQQNPPPGTPPPATDPSALVVAPGFKVELLYSVPRTDQGSWVCLTLDPKGRLIAGDQYGGLYRITLPPLGSTAQ